MTTKITIQESEEITREIINKSMIPGIGRWEKDVAHSLLTNSIQALLREQESKPKENAE